MSNELNWFHIRRWNKNKAVRKHQFEMAKKNPSETDDQIIRAIAQNNVTIIRKDTEDENRKQTDNESSTKTATLDSTQYDSSSNE